MTLPLRANVVTPGKETKVGLTGGNVPRRTTWPLKFSGATYTEGPGSQAVPRRWQSNHARTLVIRNVVSAAGNVDGACPWSPRYSAFDPFSRRNASEPCSMPKRKSRRPWAMKTGVVIEPSFDRLDRSAAHGL